MSGPVLRWSGSPEGEGGWFGDLCAYLRNVQVAEVAIGRLPPTVRSEFDRALDGKAAGAAESFGRLLVACQSVYGQRQEGVVGQSALTAVVAAYAVDRAMTLDAPEDEEGHVLSVTVMPTRNEPFMLARTLAQYVAEGFPEDFEPSHEEKPKSSDWQSSIKTVRELDLTGESANSSNGRFVLVWESGDRSRWALLDNGKVLKHGRCQMRAAAGAVSDVGRFALAEIHAEDLRSRLIVHEWAGGEVLRAQFEALAGPIGLSDDGRYAAIKLYQSPLSPEDSGALIFFELGRQEPRWRRTLTNVAPSKVAIDTSKAIVDIVNRQEATLSFHLDGRTLVDDPSYLAALLRDASWTQLALMGRLRAEDCGQSAGSDEATVQLFMTSVEKATDPAFKARALRDLGELHFEAGDVSRAINCWRKALSFNPNVGVKKRLAELEKGSGVASPPIEAPRFREEGRLRVVSYDQKVRGNDLVVANGSIYVSTVAKGEGVLSRLEDGLPAGKIASFPGGSPRVTVAAVGLVAITDQGRVGDGAGWVTLLDWDGHLLAQREFTDKLTDAAIEGATLAVGCRDGCLHGLNQQDLSARWQWKVPGQGDDYAPAHPYRVASGGGLIWTSYLSTFFCLDTSGRLLLKKPVDMSGSFFVLPDGTLVTTIFKGVVFLTSHGKVHLVPTREWNPRIWAVDIERRRIYAGRWGQGELWQVYDFDRRVIAEASLGDAQHCALSTDGKLAVAKREMVTVYEPDLSVVGTFRQPEVAGNATRAIAWLGGELVVLAKGLWRLKAE